MSRFFMVHCVNTRIQFNCDYTDSNVKKMKPKQTYSGTDNTIH